jgi:hypothetical protein
MVPIVTKRKGDETARGRNSKGTKRQGDETTGDGTARGRNDQLQTSPPPPLPNNSKYWSKLVKMENILLKLVEVAGQTWKKFVKVWEQSK